MRRSKFFTAAITFALLAVMVLGCPAPTPTPNRAVSESVIAQILFSSWIPETLKVSPCSKRVAYGAQVGDKWFVVVDGEEQKQYDGIGASGPIFSPCSRRVAYGAQVGDKWFVVVDGKEEKQYDGIMEGTPIFCPDSKRVAYGAQVGDKWFVVVDGEEGKQYDGIVTLGGGKIIFDSPDSLHYLASKGNSVYLVEERIIGKVR